MPSSTQVAQLLVVGLPSDAADTTCSPCAASVGFIRPSCTGPGLEKIDGVSAFVPCPTDPTEIKLFAFAGDEIVFGAGHSCPAFPAEVTSRRSG